MSTDKAKALESNAQAVEVQVEKPLPAMAQPTVNLLVEIRQMIAQWCRDNSASFSVKTNLLWIDMLVSEGKIDKAKVEALIKEATTVKRGGGVTAYKERAEAAEGAADLLRVEKEKLEKALAELKAKR